MSAGVDSTMRRLRSAFILLALCAAPALAAGRPANEAAGLGLRIAQDRCAICHLIDNRARQAGKAKGSPNPSAPPFQVLAMTYEPADLEEALAEGIVVGHNAKGDPQMPEFALGAREASALVAYLQTLRRR